MAKPISRETLIDYCLRQLGAPVIEINVDEDQIEDRIDDALQFYQEYHSDAIYRYYLKHEVTADDVTNEYLPISDNILFVQRIFPVNENSTTGGSLFNANYQIRMNDLYNLNFAGSIQYYEQLQQHMSLLDMKLNGSEAVRFNRHMNRLHIDFEWGTDIKEGQFLIVDCYRIVEPETFTDVYNDMFLKRYATALIKKQWGANLIKFEGMQLPGGVTLNGRQLFDDATQEIEKIEEEMQLKYEKPPMFFVG